MNLKILLPFYVFARQKEVTRIVAEARGGTFGLLPHRLDCVAALVPGILIYETPQSGTAYIAVDEGVLVKSGTDVFVAVRRAIGGSNFNELQQAVKREFLRLNSSEREVRTSVASMEASLIGRLMEFQRER